MTGLITQFVIFLCKDIDVTEIQENLNPFRNLDNINNIADVIQLITITITGFASLIAIGYIVYGGYQYITSAGNPESSKQATSTITWSVVGLIVILIAYLIIEFVMRLLVGAPVEP